MPVPLSNKESFVSIRAVQLSSAQSMKIAVSLLPDEQTL